MLHWVAVDAAEEREIQQADDACGGEAEPPADMKKQQADERHADGGRELCGGVKEAGRESALLRREPEADGFCVGGEGGRFADAEQKARAEEGGNAAAECGGKGGGAPDERADAADAAHSEPVEEHAPRELRGRVGPVVGAEQKAEGDVGDAEVGAQGVMGDGEVDAVEVVDEDADAEQRGDGPAVALIALAHPRGHPCTAISPEAPAYRVEVRARGAVGFNSMQRSSHAGRVQSLRVVIDSRPECEARAMGARGIGATAAGRRYTRCEVTGCPLFQSGRTSMS